MSTLFFVIYSVFFGYGVLCFLSADDGDGQDMSVQILIASALFAIAGTLA